LDDSIDYYALLGVEKKATSEEIKRAYRKLVFQYHPDRNPDNPEAAEKLKDIMAAYDILSNEESRAQYDGNKGFRNDRGDGKKSPGNGSHFYEFKQRLEPEPQCPICSVVGVDHVISRKSGSGMGRGKQFITSPFQVIFCDQCGHVYGVAGSSS
jgi:curved DNA-binding protein CbpA